MPVIQHSPYRRRHLGLKAAGLIAWAVAASGIAAYAFATVKVPSQLCIGAKPPAAAVPAHVPAAAHRSVPGTPAAAQSARSVSQVSLAGLSWVDYHGAELPVSAQAGPRDTARGLASGYADTATGALMAAVNITARTSWQFGPAVFRPTITGQVTGTFAAALLAANQGAWDSGAPESVSGPQGVRVVAFSVGGFTPAGATVEVVSGVPGVEHFAVTQVQVAWLRGDWRAVAPPGGDWANSAAQLNSADGFTPFPGQGG